jgi:hypothetical protein
MGIGCLVILAIPVVAAAVFVVDTAKRTDDDVYAGDYAAMKAGTQIGQYANITLKDGHHISFLDNPTQSKQGGLTGDLSYNDGTLRVQDKHVVRLGRNEQGTYTNCRDALPRRVRRGVSEGYVRRDERFCVTTAKGVIALIEIKSKSGYRSVGFKLTVWKGPRPKA